MSSRLVAAASMRMTARSAPACWRVRCSSVTSRMTPTKPIGRPSQPLMARTWTSAQRSAPAVVRKRCSMRASVCSPAISGANERVCDARSSGCTNSQDGRPSVSSSVSPVAAVQFSLRYVQRPSWSVSKTQSTMLSTTRR